MPLSYVTLASPADPAPWSRLPPHIIGGWARQRSHPGRRASPTRPRQPCHHRADSGCHPTSSEYATRLGPLLRSRRPPRRSASSVTSHRCGRSPRGGLARPQTRPDKTDQTRRVRGVIQIRHAPLAPTLRRSLSTRRTRTRSPSRLGGHPVPTHRGIAGAASRVTGEVLGQACICSRSCAISRASWYDLPSAGGSVHRWRLTGPTKRPRSRPRRKKLARDPARIPTTAIPLIMIMTPAPRPRVVLGTISP